MNAMGCRVFILVVPYPSRVLYERGMVFTPITPGHLKKRHGDHKMSTEMADIIMLRTVAMVTSTSFAQRANLRKLGDVCPSLNSYEKLGPGCYQPPKLIVDPTQSDAGFHANVVERGQSGFIQVSQHYCFERALLYGSHD